MLNQEEDTILVSGDDSGLRLDKYLSKLFPHYSRSYFQYLIQSHLVLVNGSIVKKAFPLKENDEIEVEFAYPPEISLEPESIPLDILYEDESILAINKPAGMVVHPAVGHWSHTFVNALLYHCKQLPHSEELRPGIVHRLDKETSGVLLAAKTYEAQAALVAAFAGREMKKEYLAICIGNPKSGLIEGAIARHPIRRKEMTVLQEKGREARTYCETIAFREPLSIVRLLPETGRTHQIRVHLKSIHAPILGDPVYGIAQFNKKYHIFRQLLHAYRLRFLHPITRKLIELQAPIPEDMLQFIDPKLIEKKVI